MKLKNQSFPAREIKNLKDMLTQSADLFGNKNAFLVKTKDDTYKGIKYPEFKKDVDALGTALISLGLKDSFIAVIGENRYEWCVTYLSVAGGTGVIVPLDKELPIIEIKNLLIRSNAAAVIFSGKLISEIKACEAELTSIKYFIGMDMTEDEGKFLSFRRLIGKGNSLLSSGDNSFIEAPINDEVLSILLFTSGTTDLAKGVMLSHKNISSNIMAVCKVIKITSEDSVLSILPLHHTYECTCGFLLIVYCGGCISFNEGLKHIAKNLKEVRPSLLLAVPLILEGMYRKIWEHAAKEKGLKRKLKIGLFLSKLLYMIGIDIRRKIFAKIHDSIGGRVRLAISGAAAIDPDVSKGFRAFGIKVLQGYGLTECSPIATANWEFSFRDASIGLPIPEVDIRIDSPDDKGIGEILVKGDNVMLGYFGNALATEKVLKDGWLYTGDLGYKDKDGFFYITGRKKNVIVTKNGKNIYPEEVEAYLDKSEYILESVVFGRDNESTGEIDVCAQIVPYFDAIKEKTGKDEVSRDEIYKLISNEVKSVNKTMPLYKHIRNFTVREEEFVKTTTKKIKRYVIEKTS